MLRLILKKQFCIALALLIFTASSSTISHAKDYSTSATPQNVIYILTDDQRFDELGFMNPIIDTPHMDQLAKQGVHFKNAFVTTALCSPSRASILTGQYMHSHGVVDNNKPAKEGTIYFPSYLQQAGYQTAFVGKWHMGGHHDDPQPGFDYWLSFAGQGDYYPKRKLNGKMSRFNINGKHVKQKGYITDELTDYTLNWLDHQRDKDKPFFVYLSHKAVHANFSPAERHKAQYSNAKIVVPESQADTEENYKGKPMWVKNQRNSWHGVDFPYHSELNVQEYKRQYHRALSAVDDSLGRINAWLKANNLDQNTAVILMGDNGFLFGEHGLIDKRNAYEESMRVPLIASIPGAKKGYVVEEMAANIDIAPTILDIAGIQEKPPQFAGDSLLPLAEGKKVDDWRDTLLYEYYWEFNFPQTPTTFAVRSDDFKLIQYHGIWDTDELYDIKNDPKEMHNLIDDPRYLAVKVKLRKDLFARLAMDGEHAVPYTKKFSSGSVFRQIDRSKAADFPDHWLRKGNEGDLERFFTPDDRRLKAGNQ
ncbi:MAG: acetylglucosamine-6-sulfatase [Actinobacteria bacterium TMED172]|nr:acetylglucosamine-6-sulfatase [Cellvibrionales bacterium]OUW33289.1 MAG: acetylglucosamine-6-sulfatase [Actinobacteria bacterium TMED172]|tara:strand:- start:2181 stop:3785 length:1605 start_codon:yes stop_codon:yes gene_type:complete